MCGKNTSRSVHAAQALQDNELGREYPAVPRRFAPLVHQASELSPPPMALPRLFAAQRARAVDQEMDTWGLQTARVPPDWLAVVQHFRGEARRPSAQRLHMVDVFAGAGGLRRAMEEKELRAFAFDVTVDSEHNILADGGLAVLLESIVRVLPGGLVWLGPPCSSWVWLSRAVTQRSFTNPGGDETRADVRVANRIAEVVAKITQVCDACGVYWVIEQPSTSLLWQYAPIHNILQKSTVRRVSVELGRVGAQSLKPLVLYGTAPWLVEFARDVRARPRPLALARLCRRRGRWVAGITGSLRRSAHYPPMFCSMVASRQAAFCRMAPQAALRQIYDVDTEQDVIVVD